MKIIGIIALLTAAFFCGWLCLNCWFIWLPWAEVWVHLKLALFPFLGIVSAVGCGFCFRQAYLVAKPKSK